MHSKSKVVFKDYDPSQQFLFPPSIADMIPKSHAVRVVSDVIDKIDLSPLLKTYKGGGASSFHPRMMLKVLIYSYLNNTYSSRRIEDALKENIHFMWLSGMKYPDHNTINRFRGHRLKGVMKEVFTQVVLLLMDSGHVDMKQVYTDGTKIEANANKYTFLWSKTIQTNKKKMKAQLEELWKYAQSVADQELQGDDPKDIDELDPEKVSKTIDSINEALKDKDIDKKKKQKLNYAKKNWPKNLERYKEQEATLGKRGSYSKTDPDATFMRMKDDHMNNGQLKPGYNLQWTTQDQFIVNYSLHQETTDTTTMIAHYNQIEDQFERLPEEAVADAGYGSEQNYEYLEGKGVKAYVKYNYFHREQQKSYKEKYPFGADRLYYDSNRNSYICPMGQQMHHIGDKKVTSKAGYESTISRYQATNCSNCPLNGACHKSKTNRIIEVNHRLNELRAQARERLRSERGLIHRSKRPVDVEAAFGNLKQNKNFKRYMLRGLEKVSIETGLLAIAINLKKMANGAKQSAINVINNTYISIKIGLQKQISCLKPILKRNQDFVLKFN